MQFDVSFEYELFDGDTRMFNVTGEREPYIPEYRRGNPDNWRPAEGGAITIYTIKCYGGISKQVKEELLDDDRFIDAVENAL